MNKKFSTYAPRPIHFIDLWRINGWRMKAYSIAHGRPLARPELIVAARDVAARRLAESGPVTAHYGVGFVGIHDGRTSNFVFVDWWADENELHHHVYVSPSENPAALEYRTPSGLAACVWDLSVMAFEREAWIRHCLQSGGTPNLDAYLNIRMDAEL
jgi:hypothetical protein